MIFPTSARRAAAISLVFLHLITTARAQQTRTSAAQGTTKTLLSRSKQPIKRKRTTGNQASIDEIKQGRSLYLSYDCAACHRISGKGCVEGVPLDGVGRRRSTTFLTQHLRDPEAHVAQNPKAFNGDPNLMPPQNLDDSEIALLVKYLQSLP